MTYETYETLHDGLLRLNEKSVEFFFRLFLALNAIQASIDSIETNSNTVVVMALISVQDVSHKSPVRITYSSRKKMER
jgi:hypothetical protein